MWEDTELPTNLQVITIDLFIRRHQLPDGPLVGPGNLPTRIALSHDVPVQPVRTDDRRCGGGRGRETRTGRGDVLVDEQQEDADDQEERGELAPGEAVVLILALSVGWWWWWSFQRKK